MAKKFFYVCAGLFLLVGGYSLGARTAQGQSGMELTALGIADATSCGGFMTVDAQGRVLTNCGDEPWHQVASLPGPAADLVTQGRDVYVALRDGSIYVASMNDWVFRYFGTVYGPTSTERTSWGALKARYR